MSMSSLEGDLLSNPSIIAAAISNACNVSVADHDIVYPEFALCAMYIHQTCANPSPQDVIWKYTLLGLASSKFLNESVVVCPAPPSLSPNQIAHLVCMAPSASRVIPWNSDEFKDRKLDLAPYRSFLDAHSKSKLPPHVKKMEVALIIIKTNGDTDLVKSNERVLRTTIRDTLKMVVDIPRASLQSTINAHSSSSVCDDESDTPPHLRDETTAQAIVERWSKMTQDEFIEWFLVYCKNVKRGSELWKSAVMCVRTVITNDMIPYLKSEKRALCYDEMISLDFSPPHIGNGWTPKSKSMFDMLFGAVGGTTLASQDPSSKKRPPKRVKTVHGITQKIFLSLVWLVCVRGDKECGLGPYTFPNFEETEGLLLGAH